MDLSKIEGLTEEQQAAITAMYNTDTEGLRNKNEQLLGEKKSMQTSAAEQAQIAEDARLAAVKAEEQRLISEGKTDELTKHYESQLAEQTATANEAKEKAQNALKQRDISDTLKDALPMFHDSHKTVGEVMLSNMLNISYNDQGEAITEFKHNNEVVAKSVEEFKGWASEQDTFKQYLNGVDSSGAGATNGSRSGASDAGNTIEQKLAQRLKAQGITN